MRARRVSFGPASRQCPSGVYVHENLKSVHHRFTGTSHNRRLPPHLGRLLWSRLSAVLPLEAKRGNCAESQGYCILPTTRAIVANDVRPPDPTPRPH